MRTFRINVMLTFSLTQGYLYKFTLPKSSPVATNCFPFERSTEFTSVPSAPSGQIPGRENRQDDEFAKRP